MPESRSIRLALKMRRLKLDLTGGNNLIQGTQTLEHLFLYRSIHLYHRHCFPAAFTPTEMEMTDINSAFSQNSADPPDDARHVAIAHDQHVPVRYGFDPKAANFCDATFSGFGAIAEDSSGKCLFSTVRNNSRLNGRNRLGTSTKIGRRNRYPALFNDQE